MSIFARFRRDQSGASAIEYGLIAFCLVVGILVAVQSIGTTTQETFTSVDAGLN